MAELPEFLTSKHPAYEEMLSTWQENERRLRGGKRVRTTDLHPWSFETSGSAHLRNRQSRACYTNFPAEFMTQVRGHLDMKYPEPGRGLNYGSLGGVRAKPDGSPTKAEILHENANGVGRDSLSLRDFLMAAVEKGGATGHRWIQVTRPPLTQEQKDRLAKGGSLTEEDEKAGQRPYLVDQSPTGVHNWYIENGVLQWIRFEYQDRSPRLDDKGKFTMTPRTVILLYVRKGYELFGNVHGRAEGSDALYSDGGWWKYDEDGKLLDTGNLELTQGDIPISPLIVKNDDEYFSRPITTELSQIAVSEMNLDSAADHDSMVSGSRRIIVVGADGKTQTVIVKQMKDGSLVVGIPESSQQKFPMQVIDSAGMTANEGLERRIDRKFQKAEREAMREVTAGPQASGESRRVDFAAKKSPLLAQIASSMQTCMTTTLRFVQMMWGEEPDATVKWDRQFDLVPLVDDIKSSFGLMRDAGVSSATLKSALIIQDAKEKGFITGDGELDEQAILDELKASAERQSQSEALLGNFGL